MTDQIGPAREPASVRVRVIAAGMAGALAVIVAAVLGLYGFYRAAAPTASFVPPRNFPAPRLQTQNDALREPAIAQQQARLRAYAWIDRSRGVVQIPIDRAMALIVARGDRAYDPIARPAEAMQP
jgi:hypothetical protein